MVRRIRMDLDALHRAVAGLPAQYQEQQARSVALACGVVRGFLGDQWFVRHVESQDKKGFFTINEHDPVKQNLSLLRIVDLAEVLFNLQHAPGFDECIERLRNGVVEGTFAELDFGRMLYINRVPFRFVIPQGVKRSDYDIEVLYSDGLVACADAKCKIESTEFTENGIRNVLNEARKQLPSDRPGIVFVKTPARWIVDEAFLSLAGNRARRFLGGAPCIVSVKFYASDMVFANNAVTHRHAFREYSNPKTRFGSDIDWNLFDAVPGIEIPKHWQRILFFPDGMRK